jgi:glutathione S-transferase
MAFMEADLAPGPWFIGADFSAADIQMSFPIEAANQRAGLSAAKTPRLLDWLKRAHARPAYQRALDRGGKYDFA